jgi:hypothetical protein
LGAELRVVGGADIGCYDDSEIQRWARKLAQATAEKIFRAS